MKLTKKQVEQIFREEVLPNVRKMFEQDGRVDRIARAEEWNNFVDMLAQDRQITEQQASTWSNPF